MRSAAERLLFNRLCSVGVGLRRPSPSDKNLIYFPIPKGTFLPDDVPVELFNRIVPGGETSKYFAILTETT